MAVVTTYWSQPWQYTIKNLYLTNWMGPFFSIFHFERRTFTVKGTFYIVVLLLLMFRVWILFPPPPRGDRKVKKAVITSWHRTLRSLHAALHANFPVRLHDYTGSHCKQNHRLSVVIFSLPLPSVRPYISVLKRFSLVFHSNMVQLRLCGSDSQYL